MANAGSSLRQPLRSLTHASPPAHQKLSFPVFPAALPAAARITSKALENHARALPSACGDFAENNAGKPY